MATIDDRMQDDGIVADALRDQDAMAAARAPWERVWRDIDRRLNLSGDGAFLNDSVKGQRPDNFDATAIEGHGRWSAVIAALSIPKASRWHGIGFADVELMKLPAVQKWCEVATDVLFGMRYFPMTGFVTQSKADIMQLGSYGTAPLWIDEIPGQQIFYKSIHLSEVYIDENFAGRVDKAHRKFTLTARQAQQQFEEKGTLSPKMQKAISDRKWDERFEILHVVRPNARRERDRLDFRRHPVESLYIALDEKWILRQAGFASMPICVSRNPGGLYGRSPAMNVIGTIKGVNEMARTILRAGQKAVDPALAFFDDGEISKLVTRPGGMNPGLVDDMGRLLVQPVPGGGNLPFGLELLERDRGVVQKAFLEELFNLLSNPADRMTATQVLETLQKEGILVAPFAEQYEAEKLVPMIDREIDIGFRSRSLPPYPPEVLEAGVSARPVMTNPMSRMARAEEAAGFARWSEMLVQIAPFDNQVIDLVNADEAARGVAEVLGVRPSWVASPDQVAAKRQAREEKEQVAQLAAAAPDAAGAVLDLAQAEQLRSAA